MGRYAQLKVLIQQELKQAVRSKSVILSFLLIPLLMWGFQGGLQAFMINMTSNQQTDTAPYQGYNFFVVNQDEGNGSFSLGNLFVNAISSRTFNDSSRIYQARMVMITDISNYNQAVAKVSHDELSPLLYIPANFTECYTNFNVTNSNATIFPVVYILSHPSDRSFGWALLSETFEVTGDPPFTSYTIHKHADLRVDILTYEGEEDASDSFVIGFIAFLTTVLAIVAPLAFVTSAFAGEKEKHTLEGLLVLPLERFDIFLGKLAAGMSLISVFSVMNVVGLYLYSFLINSSIGSSNSLTDGFTITGQMVFAVFLMVFLSSFISIGIGIAIASYTKDSSTAEGIYMMLIMGPAIVIGMMSMLGTIPTGFSWFLLIPWTHSITILNKLIFPQSYATTTLTGSVTLDIVLHLSYLLLFVVGSMVFASKTFDREGIIN